MLMKRFAVTMAMVLAGCAVVQGQTRKAAPAAPRTAPNGGLPKDAVANDNGTWTYTDAQQRRWIYSKTPFGYTRTQIEVAAGAKRPAGVPANAVAIGDGNYSWTGPDGKNWRLVPNPFGVSKLPADEPGTGVVAQTALKDVKARDQGDRVRFEVKTPMGTSSWEKKKSEMTADEKRIFAEQNGSGK